MVQLVMETLKQGNVYFAFGVTLGITLLGAIFCLWSEGDGFFYAIKLFAVACFFTPIQWFQEKVLKRKFMTKDEFDAITHE